MVDYDSEPPTEELNIRVQVTDPDFEDFVDVKFIVTDVNDNAPVFVPELIEVTESEDIAVGTSIATFTATDIDSGDNAQFTYVHSRIVITVKCTSIRDSSVYSLTSC